MKHWVFTFRVEPPAGTVFSARNAEGSYFFCAYIPVLRRWEMVVPGGPNETIDEPQMIFVTQEYADTHKRDGVGRRPSIKLREGKQKSVQYELAI